MLLNAARLRSGGTRPPRPLRELAMGMFEYMSIYMSGSDISLKMYKIIIVTVTDILLKYKLSRTYDIHDINLI